MVRKAIYYDKKLDISSLLDDRVYKAKPEDYQVLDYDSISSWLDGVKPGDILVFAQDVVPFTAYDIRPESTESKLLNFLRNGGIVVWLGDAPFMYRVRCFDSGYYTKVWNARWMFKKYVAFSPSADVYVTKFGPYERGDRVCMLDIIGGFYTDLEKVTWISHDYKHLNFFKLNYVCFLNQPAYTVLTLTGKLFGYNGTVTLRPTRVTTRIFPLNTLRLEGICEGKYAGSWIADVGEGYFVRLYDVKDEIDTNKVFEIAERISNLVQKTRR